jgi:UDP-N-acetylmuramoyl-tripeptide--D-alanyl-D-alanine ligase
MRMLRKRAPKDGSYPLNLLARTKRLWLTDTTFIAFTGSCGKSTAIALTEVILSSVGKCRKGVDRSTTLAADTVLRADRSTSYCLLEAHAGFPGGLRKSLWAFQPQIGVVTTIGDDHYSNYRSHEAIAREKGHLVESLPENGVGVLNIDDALIADMAKRTRARLLTFGRSPEADLRAFDVSSDWPERMSMSVAYQGETVRVQTKLLGKHWPTSVLAAIGVGLACSVDLKTCAQIVERTDPVLGRYTVHVRDDGAFFVLDCHKAPYWTIVEGLTFVKSVSAPRKTIIFGTISDYPGAAGPRYRRIARDALEVADRVILVGPHAGHIDKLLRRGIGKDRLFGFQTTCQASAFIDSDEIAGELIYVKASVAQHLERIMLARLDKVVCWRETCGSKRACMSCQHFRTVQPLPFGMTVGTAAEHQTAL